MVNNNHYNDMNLDNSYTGLNLINNDFVKLSLLFAEDRNKISEKKLNKKLNQLLNSFNDDQFVKDILTEIIEKCCEFENYEAAVYFRDNLELISK